MIRFLYRTTKLGFSNFLRNSWLSFVTIFIVFLALFSIFVLATVNMVGSEALHAVKDKVDVDIFFELSASENDLLAAQQFLMSLPDVRDVEYISSEEALQDFRELHEDDPVIKASLNEIDTNPLPAALVVKAYSLEQYPEILAQLDASEHAELIASNGYVNNETVISRLSSITANVSMFGIGISVLFIVVGILVVFNSIRITIYTHREEIGIMKLVGASNAFVRMPFIVESVIYAGFATLMVFGIGYPLIVFAAPVIDQFFGGFEFSFMHVWGSKLLLLIGLEFGIGLFMCMASTFIAVRRYLKV